jgi:putative acetyltransferase
MEMDDDNGIADGGGGGRAQCEQGRLGIANSVDVLTIHKAKGLEWAHVFVACATESHLGTPTSAISSGMGRRRRQALGADLPMPSLPSSNPDHSLRKKPDGIGRNEMAASADDEARKLFYVAMTRARESLTFTSARHYGSGNGRGRTSAPGTPEQECLFVSEAVNDAFDAKTGGEGSSFSGRVVIAPADPGIARDLLDASAFLMDSLFPPEDNHHLLLGELRCPDIRFFVAQEVGKSFMDDGDDTAGNASGKDRVNVIGCAALALRDGYGEVKSMFVHKRARGKGVGRSLLVRVEEEAHRQALPVLRLETGCVIGVHSPLDVCIVCRTTARTKLDIGVAMYCGRDLLHDALRLYASAGFVRLAHPFGDYPMNDTSVFMEKHISISRT